WQSRHHSISRVLACDISGMLSTSPWQLLQPTPLFMCMPWSKYTNSGRSCTRSHLSECPVRKLARTGSSIGALVQICEWQFMQVLVGGIPAKFESSTEV